MAWSWEAWAITTAVVIASAAVSAREGTFRRRAGLDLAFVEHGGMWSDLLLLPIVNAAIVPHLIAALTSPDSPATGRVLSCAYGLCAALALALTIAAHRHWYRGDGGRPWREHLWPHRHCGTWARDLSLAGWLHVIYMTGELAVILAYAITPVPDRVVWFVSGLLSVHVPIGILLPARVTTGRSHAGASRAMLVGALGAIWVVGALKVVAAR